MHKNNTYGQCIGVALCLPQQYCKQTHPTSHKRTQAPKHYCYTWYAQTVFDERLHTLDWTHAGAIHYSSPQVHHSCKPRTTCNRVQPECPASFITPHDSQVETANKKGRKPKAWAAHGPPANVVHAALLTLPRRQQLGVQNSTHTHAKMREPGRHGVLKAQQGQGCMDVLLATHKLYIRTPHRDTSMALGGICKSTDTPKTRTQPTSQNQLLPRASAQPRPKRHVQTNRLNVRQLP